MGANMDFENCTLVELRQLAKEKGIKNTSKLKKEELIEALMEENNTDVNNITDENSKDKNENAINEGRI